ncbi:hypothetical protein NDU88_000923 [Pleurodeles waltl]|uniref:Uncharacterized protein n=1 Tax=Pleurodeles waltl TaxID=8319 RepID=A0AAV7MI98_PLEWA|nr:hypothetical protein NDU88_000923 [Pleurodeles waltl]
MKLEVRGPRIEQDGGRIEGRPLAPPPWTPAVSAEQSRCGKDRNPEDNVRAGREFDLLPKADGGEDGQVPSTDATSTDAKMLQMICNMIKELQVETRAESGRARIATKQLQGTVRKVARTCTEIEEKLNAMENRTAAVEVEVEALKEQAETHERQLTDIMWKLEDHENRQRRNNLRFLGIEEGVEAMIERGVEGNYIRSHMIKLLRNAFPELTR